VDESLKETPFDMLHGEVGAIAELAYFVDRNYVGMGKFGCCLSFAFEARPTGRIMAKMSRKKLESDFAMEFRILCEEYITHAAGTDLLDDPVVVDYSPVRKYGDCSRIVVVIQFVTKVIAYCEKNVNKTII
jgi:hypothetical protein